MHIYSAITQNLWTHMLNNYTDIPKNVILTMESIQ